MKSVDRFILQAIDRRTNAEMISINSAEDHALHKKLEDLFSIVSIGASKKGLEFLKSALPPQ